MSNLSLIPIEKIIERLRYENPWWVTKQIPEVYSSMAKRLYFSLFYPYVTEKNIRRALFLMGPRRVGKPVMLFHSIQQLLTESVNPQKIFFIGIDTLTFQNKFVRENDWNKRLYYMLEVRQMASDFVLNTKKTNSKDWKEIIYFEMMDVQSLKLRFGSITFNISENIKRYSTLISKYKSDPHIGNKVENLESKLHNLKEIFDSAFEPVEYLNSVTRMYKIH